jgi:DNA-binding transcriptional ArsR family regulator
MADLLPSSPDTSAAEDPNPRVIGVDSDDADALIGALSSDTARALLAALHDEPTNPAKLADAVDTTIQNAQYHLGKLEDAGLIEVVDTVYSEKGREMNVYAPSDRPLVVVAGREEDTSGLQTALSRLLGALAALALGSALVQQLLVGDLVSLGSGGGSDRNPPGVADAPTATEAAGDAMANATATSMGTGTPTPSPTSVELAERTTTELPTIAAQTSTDVAPGVLFFAGGAAVLVLVFAFSYLRTAE